MLALKTEKLQGKLLRKVLSEQSGFLSEIESFHAGLQSSVQASDNSKEGLERGSRLLAFDEQRSVKASVNCIIQGCAAFSSQASSLIEQVLHSIVLESRPVEGLLALKFPSVKHIPFSFQDPCSASTNKLNVSKKSEEQPTLDTQDKLRQREKQRNDDESPLHAKGKPRPKPKEGGESPFGINERGNDLLNKDEDSPIQIKGKQEQSLLATIGLVERTKATVHARKESSLARAPLT